MLITLFFIFGLALGSFVNALVWRIHELQHTKSAKKRKKLSPVSGRSMCTNCSHELAVKDLVPIISWLSLGGKCRYCKKPVSAQYPFVELLGATLSAVSFLLWPYKLAGLGWVLFTAWLGIVTVLLALTVYDFKWMELPDRLVAVVTGIAVFFVVLEAIYIGGFNIIGRVTGALLLFGLFYLLFQLSKGRWIGGGDVKLAPALGLLAGSPLKAMLLLFVASLIGTGVGVPMMIKQKSKRNIKLPFGPLLIIGLVFVFFFGNDVIDWYKTNVLYL